MTRKILIGILAILVVIQFFHPEKNLSDDNTYGVATGYPVPENVNNILVQACNDCHSNKTVYPWYSKIQPIDWWLSHHVDDGKRHLNFSTFTKLPIAVQNHKFEEIIEMVKENEMPLPSYTWFGLHEGADITEEQRTMITSWASAQMDSLKRTYPPDSLVLRRRGQPK